MRLLGTLNQSQSARQLTDYLLAQGIQTQVDGGEGEWSVWVKDEDQLAAAKQIFAEYQQRPNDPRYVAASEKASEIRAQEQTRRTQYRRNVVVMRDAWRSPSMKRTPAILALLLISVLSFWATQFGAPWDPLPVPNRRTPGQPGRPVARQVHRSWDQSRTGYWLLFHANPYRGTWSDILQGQVWRLFTPMFLHGSIPHLVFNLYWLVLLGGQIERRQGALCFLAVVALASLTGNVAQAVAVSANFGGLSGVVYGLVGYLAVMEKLRPDLQLVIGQTTFRFMVIVMLLGFVGGLERLTGSQVANWCHAGGLAGGMAAASWFSQWREFPRPFQRSKPRT